MSSRPLIIAHRGASSEAPENTLAAFELAISQGSDAIELDIHLSADGEIIVCHDATINRTTSGTGFVREMTASELKRVDAGSWFSEKYAGERLPLLEEVFDLVPKDMMVNVEIKNSYQGEIEPKLMALLSEKNRMDSVIVSSFHHKSLLRLKQLEPEVKISLLYFADFINHRQVAERFEVPVYSIHPNFRLIGREDVKDAVDHGLHVFLCVVNDEQKMKVAIEYGATGILTDFPEKLRQVLEKIPSSY